MKKIQISDFKYYLHPKLAQLIHNDAVVKVSSESLHELSEDTLKILLSNIVLNVVEREEGGYYLLSKSSIFFRLSKVQASHKMYVNLNIHKPNSDEALFELLCALNLILPALNVSAAERLTQNIYRRFCVLNMFSMIKKLPSLASLARLANRTRSVFRVVQK